MNIFWAVFLGIVQGLTEFIPVSSSGHLVLFQNLIPGFNQPGILFDVILHLATLTAVFYFFRKTLMMISKKYILLLVVGTIPAALAGYFFHKQFVALFGSINALGIEFLITGLLNMLVDSAKTVKKTISLPDSFAIGIAQAIAIIPGISRSGATIFTGVKLGIDREKVAEFSFLLSIPAILGANILQLIDYQSDAIIHPSYYLVGFMSALITGYLSIGVVYKFIRERKFRLFGVYCILLGFLTIIVL